MRRVSNRIRMAVVPDFEQTTMLAFVKQHVAPGRRSPPPA
jgi:hypothetical protein